MAPRSWRDGLPSGVRPYAEAAPIAAFLLGVSSGFPYTMIGATLTTRLAQHGIEKSTVTAFTLGFLAYNLKFLWAWVVDGVRLPVLGRLGQRVSWLVVAGTLVMAAIANLAFQDPTASVARTAMAAILVAVAGATFDIVIDAYRIEISSRASGVGSGMSQYGWRVGSVAAGAPGARAGGASDGRGYSPPPRSRCRRRRASSPASRSAMRPTARRGWAGVGLDHQPFASSSGAWSAARAAVHPGPQDRRHARPARPAPPAERHGLATTRSRSTTSASASGPTSSASSSAASCTRRSA